MNNKKTLSILGFVFGGFLASILYWSFQPSFTIARTASAVFFKNKESFYRFVDVEKVAIGLADDAMTKALKDMGADPLGDPGLVQSALALKMLESLKPQLQTYVTKTVETFFEGDPVVNSSGQSLNSVVLMLLGWQSNLKFNWKFTTEKGPDFAFVTVGFWNSNTMSAIPIRFRLEKVQGDWRIVRLYNVVESLSEK